jgi:predicted PhzF superfamily epimerase YddE/YHI9
MAVFDAADDVAAVDPDPRDVLALDRPYLIVTAPGEDRVDFVSRFFAPAVGVPEDPVTGSAHCTLIPYWAQRLGKDELFARQISARGGELWCTARGDRVQIAGHAVLVIEGTLHVP